MHPEQLSQPVVSNYSPSPPGSCFKRLSILTGVHHSKAIQPCKDTEISATSHFPSLSPQQVALKRIT